MNIRVSVVVIFYDAAAHIGEAVESVLGQDFGDFELLLVDDGSTDGSSEIASDYAKRFRENVRYLCHDQHQNLGMSVSRNLGISNAQGDLIAFIDADDRWRPTKLKEQIAVLDRNPEAQAVCGAVNYWQSWAGGRDALVETGHVKDQLVEPPGAALNWYPLGTAHAPSMSDLLMRASAVRAVGGFEPRFVGAYEDQAFLAKFYLQSSIYVSSSLWSDYRLHDRSCMSTTIKEGRYESIRGEFLDWLSSYLEQRPELQYEPVMKALERARFRHEHPRLARPMRWLGAMQRTLGFQ